MTDFRLRSVFEQVLGSESGRMIVISPSPFLCAAVNDGGRAAVFFRVSLDKSQAISDGQGFEVRATRSGNNDYLQITAKERGLSVLFLKMVEYLMGRVTTTSSVDEGIAILARSIEEYRQFVGRRRGRLSEEQVRGTFAELFLMRSLLGRGLTPEVAVESWRGPWAKAGMGLHDFTFADGRGFEVKSTHQPPRVIRVSSPNQLVPSNQELDLLVLPLEEAPDSARGAISFRELCQEIAQGIATRGPLVLERWEAALDALGLDLADDWYERYRFLPGEWRRYKVSDGFPHLDLASVPAAILEVRYSLELSRLTSFLAPFGEIFGAMGLE